MGKRKELTSSKNVNQNDFSSHNRLKSKINGFTMKSNNLLNKSVAHIVKTELEFISKLFDVTELAKLNSSRRDAAEEDEDFEKLQFNGTEQKLFKKHSQNKGTSQTSSRNKSFPTTVEGLTKELEELKGTPMTYQIKLRKKGLHSRLVKKKRKEEIKQRKAALKKGQVYEYSSPAKIKSVLNSNGNVVSNKFEFADSNTKKDGKRKLSSGNSDINKNMENKSNINLSGNLAKIPKVELSSKEIGSSDKRNIKTEKSNLDKESLITHTNQNITHNGPVFNKDNKMVFSKVLVSENEKKYKKNNINKDPKKILKKIKENSKKIKELEQEDYEKATLLKDKQKWATALKRASGEKVKDDQELLKKTINRDKNKKMRSQKKWKARIEHVQKEKDERQKKRTENIKARKNEKKKHKFKRAIKKGSFVPL